MVIGDTFEEAVNINETATESVEETEPAENADNTEKFGNTIIFSEIYIFILAVENLQFNCDQYNKTNSSEKGLTQHMWMKDKKQCEAGNIKCNMEHVPMGHNIHSNQINIWNVNWKYHTHTDHTQRHMFTYPPCVKKSISPVTTQRDT